MRLRASLAGAALFALAACSPADETPAAAPDPGVETETAASDADLAPDSAAIAPTGFKVHGDARWSAEFPALDEPRLIVDIIERAIDGERSKATSSQPLEGGPPLTFRIPVPMAPGRSFPTERCSSSRARTGLHSGAAGLCRDCARWLTE